MEAASHPASHPASVDGAALDGAGGGNQRAGARHVVLETAYNMRDIGGYPAAGGHVRGGQVFRADNVARLSPADCRTIRRLGITTVLDLRTSEEVAGGCFPVHEVEVRLHHLPLLDAMPDPDRFRMAPGVLAAQYQEIAEDAAPQVGRALTLLAAEGGTPAIVHCAAGKDRTGVLIAVLLALLGVDDRTIADDYALSGEAMGPLRRSLVERYPEGREVIMGADELFSADPANIVHLLEVLRDGYGSIEAYAEHAGAGPGVVADLRRGLVEPGP